ncbi:hypothetical protein SP3_00194 [Bacillus phage fHSPT3]
MKKTLQDIENWRKVINAIKQDSSKEGAFKLEDLKYKEAGDKSPTIDDSYFERLMFTYEIMRDFLYELHSYGELDGYAYEEVFDLIDELEAVKP